MDSDIGFPFSLPLFQAWQALDVDTPVTFFVGENGTGKSTLMEGLALAAGSITVGAEGAGRDQTLAHLRRLGDALKLTWNKRTRKGFFLRAEDFFGYVKAQNQLKAEMQDDLARVDEEYEGRSDYAKGLARMPFAGQLGEMGRRYGAGLDARSHGESFLALFQARFVPGGLYLLDEPEAPLSPLRQLTLLALLKDMVGQEAQFIIATHSPILMAFPEARLLSFDAPPVKPVAYDSLEHVTLTRDFLADPEAFLNRL
jgi:predicted ATPase